MIQVIDNVIASRYRNTIEAIFFGDDCYWNFNSNVSGDNKTKQVGLSHQIIYDFKHYSKHVDFLLPLVFEISDKSNVNFDVILQARAFLQPASTCEYDNDVFHVDVFRNHMVFLYYVNDSDGDTIILNKKYGDEQPSFLDRNYRKKDILEKVTPKKGRVVVFDGHHYHAAGIPQTSHRCILNFNVIKH